MSALAWPSRRKQREAEEALPLLAGYGRQNALQRNRGKLSALLFVLMVLYTLAFQIIGRFIPLYFMIPVAVLILLIIWALPETGRAPTVLLTRLFHACLIGFLFWPDYLAIALPSLPWITVLRMTALPLTFVFLIALSVSRDFRHALKAVTGSARTVTTPMVILSVLLAISIFYSNLIVFSFNRVVNSLLGWTMMFFVSCYVFSKPGSARRVAGIIWAATAFWVAVGFWEWRLGHVPWRDHVPGFLATQDEFVQRVLQGSERYGGDYRIQTKFFTPISFAEYLALTAPFVLHWMMTAERLVARIAAGALLPLIFLAIVGTDSRLGAAGFMLTFMIYALYWGVRRWRYAKGSILGPAIVLAYPVLFGVFMAATVFVGRLRKMVWGGGQHASSDEARQEQIEMAIPLIKSHPWGYGVGMAGDTLGYVTPAGVLTIDSYYLTMLLDIGVSGFAVFIALFLSGIYVGARRSIESPNGEMQWIAPATIALINFIIIKSVLSQIENHPLVFALLGMIVALSWRIQQGKAADDKFSAGVSNDSSPPRKAIRRKGWASEKLKERF